MKKVCVVTGTRAEYGLLKPVIEKFYEMETVLLELVVTGMHLSPQFGFTYREIERDGFPIAAKIEMLLDSDTGTGMTKSLGMALLSFADYFAENRPDITVLLGDRYEILAAATAAMMAGIPIAHIHGGEVTEGVVDEAIRHSITKMSQLHFTAAQEYKRRVIQLGEEPERVYNVGALGVENIRKWKLLDKHELESQIGFPISDKTVMVTFHPLALGEDVVKKQIQALFHVIEGKKDFRFIFTKANADANGRVINEAIDSFVSCHQENCAVFTSLGQLRYLSALQYCCMVMGNSSSGILEVPSFHIPTIDIGDRQKGRLASESVIHCGNEEPDIEAAFEKAMSKTFRNLLSEMKNPYEGEETSEKIVSTILQNLEMGIEVRKAFYDLKHE